MRKRVSPRTSAGNGSSERFGRRGRRQLQNRRGPRRSRLPGAEQQVPLLDLSRAHGGGDPRTARRAAQTVLRRHAPLLRLAAGTPRRGVPRPTTTGNPRERPENRSSDNCSRTTSRTAWWSWSATSAARNWGFPGLIAAYRESAAEAIAAAEIVELTVDRTVRVDFPYVAMNAIMRVVKEQQPRIGGADLRQPLHDAARDPRKPRSGAYRKIAQSRRLGSGRSGMKYEQRIGIFAGQLRF